MQSSNYSEKFRAMVRKASMDIQMRKRWIAYNRFYARVQEREVEVLLKDDGAVGEKRKNSDSVIKNGE